MPDKKDIKISGLTHRHPILRSACGIYVNIASRLLDGMTLEKSIYQGVVQSLSWYGRHDPFADHVGVWDRTCEAEKLQELSLEEIKSGGYVVETLEAAVWCLLTTGSYRESVLKAVNLGHDTDTTAAVVGGLAGLAYGVESIPENWMEKLEGKIIIEDCCKALADYMEELERR